MARVRRVSAGAGPAMEREISGLSGYSSETRGNAQKGCKTHGCFLSAKSRVYGETAEGRLDR